jgi:hypothetical protein
MTKTMSATFTPTFRFGDVVQARYPKHSPVQRSGRAVIVREARYDGGRYSVVFEEGNDSVICLSRLDSRTGEAYITALENE